MQPGQQKITQFDEVNSTQSGDIIPIVRGGQNKRISVENFTGVLPEGWLSPAEEWTFASFGNGVGVITIPEGNINRYPNGTRVWFKQGTPTATDRYGVVIASTTTSITIAMVNSTTLQNLAIQQPAISGEMAPRTPQNVDFTTWADQFVQIQQWTGIPNTTFNFFVPKGGRVKITVNLTGTASANNNTLSTFTAFVDGTSRLIWTCSTLNDDLFFGSKRRPVAAQTWVGELTAGSHAISFVVGDGFVLQNQASNSQQAVVEPYL